MPTSSPACPIPPSRWTASSLAATTVLFDPKRDVAVLYVPGLRATPLTFAPNGGSAGDSAIVIGFPGERPVHAGFGPDPRPHQRPRRRHLLAVESSTREIYGLRALVRPGNSGGPLISPTGQVYGVVFAAATDDPDTGYALTAAEVAADAQAGASGHRTGQHAGLRLTIRIAATARQVFSRGRPFACLMVANASSRSKLGLSRRGGLMTTTLSASRVVDGDPAVALLLITGPDAADFLPETTLNQTRCRARSPACCISRRSRARPARDHRRRRAAPRSPTSPTSA